MNNENAINLVDTESNNNGIEKLTWSEIIKRLKGENKMIFIPVMLLEKHPQWTVVGKYAFIKMAKDWQHYRLNGKTELIDFDATRDASIFIGNY